MNISGNLAAMNAASYSFAVSANNVANASTDDFKAVEVTKTNSASGPTAISKQSHSRPDIATEMVKQIRDTYDFKANAKAIKFHDEMVGTVIDMLA